MIFFLRIMRINKIAGLIFVHTKGQLISKCPFGFFKPPKNQGNFFQDFGPKKSKKVSNQKDILKLTDL